MKILSLLLLVFASTISLNHAAIVEESSLSIDFLTIFTDTETTVRIDLVWDDVTAFDPTQGLTYMINGDGEIKEYTVDLEGASELPSELSVSYIFAV